MPGTADRGISGGSGIRTASSDTSSCDLRQAHPNIQKGQDSQTFTLSLLQQNLNEPKPLLASVSAATVRRPDPLPGFSGLGSSGWASRCPGASQLDVSFLCFAKAVAMSIIAEGLFGITRELIHASGSSRQ